MNRDDGAPSVAEWDIPPSSAMLKGLRVGDFLIEERIGQGSFGAVYRARQQTLGREVVLKVLHLGRDDEEEERVRRFLREAKLASQLDHPYAAHVYAFGAERDGLLWIAMELVRGTPLSELLEVQGPLSLHRFVPLFEKICEVVHTAHQQGIVHRDLKPDNVMVIARAGTLLPKLLDLGIAKLVEDLERPVRTLAQGSEPQARDPNALDAPPVLLPLADVPSAPTRTRHGPVVGSPPYMAPEQWLDASQASARTDQYALGILAYEALTGRRPFRAPSDIGLAMAHASQPVPPLGPGFPAALDEVIGRALAKDPGERHEDVLALASALRAAVPIELAATAPRVPALDPAVRDTALARAPQPLADAVAYLEAARTPRLAVDAARQVVRVAMRLVGLLAIAGFNRIDPKLDESTRAAYAALQRLRAERLSTAGWLALARTLIEPFATKPDAYPIPELVLLFFDQGGRPRPRGLLDQLAERDLPRSLDDTQDDHESASLLASLSPELAELLGALAFLGDYPLLVHRAGRTESWMGVRRPARPEHALQSTLELHDGDVVLAAPDGELILALKPLCQLLAPAPGAPEEIFVFDGPGRYGATLVAFPVGFERHDPAFWDWYHDSLVEDPDELDAAGRTSEAEARPPYLGLSAFSPADAGHYFGREREVEACVNRLRVKPLLAVVGPSGAGKSSFVQAGIVPALPGGWRSVTVRPGPTPLAQLAARLERENIVLGDLRTRLERQPDALARALRAAASERGETLVLVVDQFEELLTLCLDVEEQRLYSEALMRTARQSDDPVRLVLTLRDDFLVRAQQLPALRERLAQSLQLLGTPPPEELVRIVIEPARRAGYTFEDAELPMEMVSAVAGEPGALALLSFTATKLWELRDRHFRRLRRRSYAALGGVGGALAQHAEDTLARMSPARQGLVREVFRQLVTADGTRAILTRRELTQMLASGEADEVIEELIRARLLVASEGDTGEDRVEVVHEALLSSWPRLVGWQREDAESARLRDQLRAAARQWVERGRSRGLLWRGDALLEYRVWRSRYRGSLTETEEAFARASVHEEARGRRRRRMLQISAFSALALGLVFVLGLERRATHERERASAFAAESRQRLLDLYLEQGRRALLDGAPTQALAYLAEVHASGADGPPLRFLLARATQALSGQRLVLAGHQGYVWTVRFSPDGTRIATGSADHRARIWDARTGALLATLSGHTDVVGAVRFSPDGTRLATSSHDGTAKVWEVASGALLWTAKHDDLVFWVDFSRDGTRIGTASADRTATIWDVASGQPVRAFAAQDQGFTAAAFTPDGARLVTASPDRSARVWDIATGALLATIPGHDKLVHRIAVSPDGARAASAGRGTRALLFSLQGEALPLADHAKELNHVAFSPDGAQVITASEDRTAKVWDAATGRLLMTLEGHASGVTFAAFSPDGQHISTLSRDGTARTWDARTGVLRWTFIGHRDGIWTGDYDPAGASMATASFDGTVRVWTARESGALLTLPGQEQQISDAQLAPDGTRIATTGHRGALQVWDRQGRLVSEIETAHTWPTVAWSSDGARLLTAGEATATLWDVATRARLLELAGHGGRVHTAAYAPDQARVVTASADRTARIWDARTGEHIVTLQGHADEVTFAAFDPASQRVVTASKDHTARIWDAATGQLTRTLAGHTQPLTSAYFSADGARVITAAEDGKAMIWSDGGAHLVTLEGHEDQLNKAVLSADGQLAVTACHDGKVGFWETASGTLLWSIDLHPSTVRSVMLDPGGELLLVAAGQTAMLRDVAYDRRTTAEIQAFVDCRVDYTLQGSRLVRDRDVPTACAPP